MLLKAIYGLVQAARQWWKKFKAELKKLGYYPSAADPCMFVRMEPDDFSILMIYVDDGGIFGEMETIDEVLTALSKVFQMKRMGPLKNFVGAKLTLNEKEDTMWVTQPKLIKHMFNKFKDQLPARQVSIPAGLGSYVLRTQQKEALIPEDKQSMYRTGVGMLLYLVKLSRPDISNAVRELTKVLDGATEAHYKAMLRVMKYIMETESHGLTLSPKWDQNVFKLRGLCDSDFAGDKDTRISVYGFILYFCGAPISWRSKSGKSVTLSSTEAEYFAISELTKEIMFVRQVLDSMGVLIELPIIIEVDNVGAIFLAHNSTTSQRTKHIDTRVHYIREFVEEGVLKIIFVKSADNDSDICTKNTVKEVFNRHSKKIITEAPKDKEGDKEG